MRHLILASVIGLGLFHSPVNAQTTFLTEISGTWTIQTPAGPVNFQFFHGTARNPYTQSILGTYLTNGIPGRYAWVQRGPRWGTLYLQAQGQQSQVNVELVDPMTIRFHLGGGKLTLKRTWGGMPVPPQLDQFKKPNGGVIPGMPGPKGISGPGVQPAPGQAGPPAGPYSPPANSPGTSGNSTPAAEILDAIFRGIDGIITD